MEGAPRTKPKHLDSQGQENGDSYAAKYSQDIAELAQLDALFDGLPETAEPNQFSAGETVKFPSHQGADDEVDWTVKRAEKGHYWLERPINGLYDHVVCADHELTPHNQR